MQSISAFKLARFSWHANDRVYVEFREQPGLDDYLGIIHAEQETILQDDCRTTVSPQTIHDSRHSQPFRCSPNRTENDSSPRLFRTAVWRIHQNYRYLVIFRIIKHISQERIIMEYIRDIQIIQQRYCHIIPLIFCIIY